jgi:hypothetical protein
VPAVVPRAGTTRKNRLRARAVPRAWYVVPARHEHDGRRAASCSCPSCSCHFVLVLCCAGRAKWPCIGPPAQHARRASALVRAAPERLAVAASRRQPGFAAWRGNAQPA